jgi:hypothetical protein
VPEQGEDQDLRYGEKVVLAVYVHEVLEVDPGGNSSSLPSTRRDLRSFKREAGEICPGQEIGMGVLDGGEADV